MLDDSQPDVTGAVSSRIPNLMSQDRAVWLSPKVDKEVSVQAETAFFRVNINLQQVGALLDQVGVELLIP